MKKILAIAFVLVASTASAAVSATRHNMNNYTGSNVAGGAGPANTGGGSGDVCYYCHAAHNTLLGQAPLWARNNPATGGYSTYVSPTISRNIAGGVDSVSLACLSCHDGSIAVNQTIKGRVGGLASNKYMTSNSPTNPNAVIGPNISNDHPVSLQWPGTAFAGLVAAMPSPFQAYSITGIGASVLTCAGCHEPHGTAFSKFLRADPNSGSFCVACHANK